MINQKIKILWVDDDVDYLKVHHLYKLENGYILTTAKSYDGAIDILNHRIDFDILILDLIIRKTEEGQSNKETNEKEEWFWGVKLAEYIRDQLTLDIPILVFSVVERHDVQEKLIDKYNASWITKGSLPPSYLAEKIIELLDINE